MITIFGRVERGDGVAIVAELALPDGVEQSHPGLVKLPLRPRVKRRVGLAVHDMRQLTPAAKAFVDVAKVLAPKLSFA